MKKLSDKVRKFSVVFTEKSFKEIQKKASMHNQKVSQFIRDGLDYWLKTSKKTKESSKKEKN